MNIFFLALFDTDSPCNLFNSIDIYKSFSDHKTIFISKIFCIRLVLYSFLTLANFETAFSAEQLAK